MMMMMMIIIIHFLGTSFMSGSVQGMWHALAQVILKPPFLGGYHYHHQVTDKNTGRQKSKETWPSSHLWWSSHAGRLAAESTLCCLSGTSHLPRALHQMSTFLSPP